MEPAVGAAYAALKKKREDEGRVVEQQCEMIRKERDELVDGANTVYYALHNFDEDYQPTPPIDFFMSPDAMQRMIEEFDFNTQQGVLALTELESNLEALGRSAHVANSVDNEEIASAVSFGTEETEKISQEHKKKIAAATARITSIFQKSQKNYNDLVQSMSHDFDGDLNAANEEDLEKAVIPILQQKVKSLQKELELAKMKSRSLSVQMDADKKRYEDILAHNRQEMLVMSQKLIVAETKKRFNDQIDRDDNMVVGTVSRVEFDNIFRECNDLRDALAKVEKDSAEKAQQILVLTNENTEKNFAIANYERSKASLEQKLEVSQQLEKNLKQKLEDAGAEAEQKMGELKSQLEQKSRQAKKAEDEAAGYKRERESLTEDVASLRRETDDNHRLIQSLEKDAKSAKTLYSQSQVMISELMESKASNEETISELKDDLQSVSEERDSFQAKLRSTISTLKPLHKKLSAMMNPQNIERLLSAQTDRIAALENLLEDVSVQVGSKMKTMEREFQDKLTRDRDESRERWMADMEQQRASAERKKRAEMAHAAALQRQQASQAARAARIAAGGDPAEELLPEDETADLETDAVEFEEFDDPFAEIESLRSRLIQMSAEAKTHERDFKGKLEQQIHQQTLRPTQTQQQTQQQQQEMQELEQKHTQQMLAAKSEAEKSSLEVERLKELLQKEQASSSILRSEMQALKTAGIDRLVALKNDFTDEALLAIVGKAIATMPADVGERLTADGVGSGILLEQAKTFSSNLRPLLELDLQPTAPRGTASSFLEAAITEIAKALVDSKFISEVMKVQVEVPPPSTPAPATPRSSRGPRRFAPEAEDMPEMSQTGFGDNEDGAFGPFPGHSGSSKDYAARPGSPEELKEMQEAMRVGDLMDIGAVQKENFDRLKNKQYGDDRLVQLTLIGHTLRYGQGFDEKKTGSSSSLSKMQHRAMEAEEKALEADIVGNTSIDTLAQYLHHTEESILEISAFNAWRSVLYYKDGGVFMDVLVVHRDVIRRCIAKAGGWRAAMALVKEQADTDAATYYWPEFFRVKVLEYYRQLLSKSLASLKASQALKPSQIQQLGSEDGNQEDEGDEEETRVEKAGVGSASSGLRLSSESRPTRSRHSMIELGTGGGPLQSGKARGQTASGDQRTTEFSDVKLAESEALRRSDVAILLRELNSMRVEQGLEPWTVETLPTVLGPSFGQTLSWGADDQSPSPLAEVKVGIQPDEYKQLPTVYDRFQTLFDDDNNDDDDVVVDGQNNIGESAKRTTRAAEIKLQKRLARKALGEQLQKLSEQAIPMELLMDMDEDTAKRLAEEISDGCIKSIDSKMIKGLLAAQRCIENASEVASPFGLKNRSEEARAAAAAAAANVPVLITSKTLRRLHQQADAIVLRLINDDEDALHLFDALLEAVECGRYKEYDESLDLFDMLKNHFADDSALELVNLLRTMMVAGGIFPDEVLEVMEKLDKVSQTLHGDYDAEYFDADEDKSIDGDTAAPGVSRGSAGFGGKLSGRPPRIKSSNASDGCAADADVADEAEEDIPSGGLSSRPPLPRGARRRRQSVQSSSGPSTAENTANDEDIDIDTAAGGRSSITSHKRVLNRRLARQGASVENRPPSPDSTAELEAGIGDLSSLRLMTGGSQGSFHRRLDRTDSSRGGDGGSSRASSRSGSGIASLAGTGKLGKHFYDSRLKRRENREQEWKARTDIRQNIESKVAEAVAVALVAATSDHVDMATQTDRAGDDADVLEIGDEPEDLLESEEQKLGHDEAAAASGSRPVSRQHLSSDQQTINSMSVPLPPGFRLVHFSDLEFEVCPGVTLASYTRLPEEQRLELPPGVAYCRRLLDGAYSNGIRRVPLYITVPRVEKCEAVILPPILEISEGVKMITRLSLGYMIELPPDIFVVQLARGANLPTGLTIVEFSPLVKMPLAFKPPPDTEIVQMHTSISMPPGVVFPSCETMPLPTGSVQLPHGLQLIKRKPGAMLPNFMTPIAATAQEEAEIMLYARLSSGCAITRKPQGFSFGLGVEILSRPSGVPMPPGISPLPSKQWPLGLKLSGSLELVQITPRFDLPVGCSPAKDWVIFPRPYGMRLPPNVYLFQYQGERGGGVLPNFARRVPMPDVPFGANIPKTVVAAEFLPSVAKPLPYGTVLSEGITVLSPEQAIATKPGSTDGSGMMLSDEEMERQAILWENICARLPINAVLVNREPGVLLPPEVQRGSRSSLPIGILLAPQVEIVVLPVRFELPAGVKLQPGAVLGSDTQLAPGTILARDLEVLERPPGCVLVPNCELVRLAVGSEMPVGYHNMPLARSQIPNVASLPSNCYVVRLPHATKIFSGRQLAENVMVVTEVAEPQKVSAVTQARKMAVGKKSGAVRMVSRRNQIDAFAEALPPPEDSQLPPGVALVIRGAKQNQLPAEMTLIPSSAMTASIKNAITRCTAAVRERTKKAALLEKSKKRRGKLTAAGSATELTVSGEEVPEEPKVVEAVALAPMFCLPPGTELVPGVVVQPRPFWLQNLPHWIELVSSLDQAPADIYGEGDEGNLEHVHRNIDRVFARKLFRNLKDCRVSVRREKDVFNAALGYQLPPNTELIMIPEALQVHSWASAAPGIEAVVRPPGLHLPQAHFLVQRPLKHAPPRGLRMGFATQYEKMALRLQLPPGMEVMHIEPSFRLPQGINMFNTYPLSRPAQHSATGSAVTAGRNSGAPPVFSTLQLSYGERLGHGVMCLSDPLGWRPPASEASHEATSAGPSDMGSEGARIGLKMEWSAYAFVLLNLQGGFSMPEGMTVVPNSDEIVTKYFSQHDYVRVQSMISSEISASVLEKMSTADLRPFSPSELEEQAEDFGADEAEPAVAAARPPVAGALQGTPVRDRRKAFLGSSKKGIEAPPVVRAAKLTSLIKLVKLPSHLLSPRDRLKEDHGHGAPPEASSEAAAAALNGVKDAITINPRVSMWAFKSASPHGAGVKRPELTAVPDSLLNLEGKGVPDVPTLLLTLEKAQKEIDQLETDNNGYRFKAVAAQRETEQLKGKLERMVEKQRSRDEEMSEVRENITDLKGQIANNLKSLELKAQDVAELRAKLSETDRRKQKQIDILTEELSRWKDASFETLRLQKKFDDDLAAMHRDYKKKVLEVRNLIFAGCRRLVDILGGTLKYLIVSMIAELKSQQVRAEIEAPIGDLLATLATVRRSDFSKAQVAAPMPPVVKTEESTATSVASVAASKPSILSVQIPSTVEFPGDAGTPNSIQFAVEGRGEAGPQPEEIFSKPAVPITDDDDVSVLSEVSDISGSGFRLSVAGEEVVAAVIRDSNAAQVAPSLKSGQQQHGGVVQPPKAFHKPPRIITGSNIIVSGSERPDDGLGEDFFSITSKARLNTAGKKKLKQGKATTGGMQTKLDSTVSVSQSQQSSLPSTSQVYLGHFASPKRAARKKNATDENIAADRSEAPQDPLQLRTVPELEQILERFHKLLGAPSETPQQARGAVITRTEATAPSEPPTAATTRPGTADNALWTGREDEQQQEISTGLTNLYSDGAVMFGAAGGSESFENRPRTPFNDSPRDPSQMLLPVPVPVPGTGLGDGEEVADDSSSAFSVPLRRTTTADEDLLAGNDFNIERLASTTEFASLSVEMRPRLEGWSAAVLEQLRSLAECERRKYYRALHLSDVELKALLSRHHSLRLQCKELNYKLAEAKRFGDGAPAEKEQLIERVNVLTLEMDRLRELSLQPGVESIRLQVAQAEDMAEALHTLTIGSQSLRGLAEEEEKKIAAELRKLDSGPEVKAMQQHAAQLLKEAADFEERASLLRRSKDETLAAIMRDVQSYERAVHDILPFNMLPGLLRKSVGQVDPSLGSDHDHKSGGPGIDPTLSTTILNGVLPVRLGDTAALDIACSGAASAEAAGHVEKFSDVLSQSLTTALQQNLSVAAKNLHPLAHKNLTYGSTGSLPAAAQRSHLTLKSLKTDHSSAVSLTSADSLSSRRSRLTTSTQSSNLRVKAQSLEFAGSTTTFQRQQSAAGRGVTLAGKPGSRSDPISRGGLVLSASTPTLPPLVYSSHGTR